MRLQTTLISAIALAGSTASAQIAVAKAPMARTMPSRVRIDDSRAVVGISTSTGTGNRDTLGLLVAAVTRSGPAEKAGIEEGNRIAMINGVSLKLATADVGDPDMSGLMGRRLTRELDKLKPGDEVTLSVYGDGQTKSIKVKTVDRDELYETASNVWRKMDERASLGIGITSTGSKRDTLGIFIMSVDEDGPAAKAGIEEGARIASINGVDLRVARDDAGDEYVSATRLNRLEREMNKIKPGDAVEVRVYQNGAAKSVKVTSVSNADLRRTTRSMRVIGGPGISIIRSPDAATLEIDGPAIAATARRAAETAVRVTSDRMEDVARVLDEMGRNLGNARGTIRWEEDETPHTKPIATPAPAPKRTVIRM